MAAAPPSARELDAIREEADRFVAARDEEDYLHFAGHKETLELEPIYERHAALADLETARTVAAAVDGDGRTRELWRFVCETHLGARTREHAERAAQLEAELTIDVDGDSIPFRMVRPALANEPDRARRQRLDEARVAASEEHLVPVHAAAAVATRQGVHTLGAASYLELYRDRFGMKLERLADECRAVLQTTESLYEEAADRLFHERAGIRLDEARRWDVARVLRAPAWDPYFPADRMLPALEATLSDLGIDLRSQRNVHLDVEQRPLKTPRAFCAPIEVPDRVMLVIQPMGGKDDWSALFHEAGHAEHFAHMSPDLSVEERRFGDNAVTEGWAAVFDNLVDDSVWLSRRLDVPRIDDLSREAGTVGLFFLRRYAAKLLYELELHAADDPMPLRSRYVELLTAALKIEPSPTDWLADVDEGFYASCYLRSWALEAQLREFMRAEFGNAWFTRREAGSLLRELWSLGQKPTAEELLRDVTGADLELEAAADRYRERLA